MSAREDAVAALAAHLTAQLDAPGTPAPDRVSVGRGDVSKGERIDPTSQTPAGSVIVFDASEEGAVTSSLGDDGPWYFELPVDVEVAVQVENAPDRFTAFDDLVMRVVDALESDKTLGGAVLGLVYEMAGPIEAPIEGAADIRAATIAVTLEFQSDTRI